MSGGGGKGGSCGPNEKVFPEGGGGRGEIVERA